MLGLAGPYRAMLCIAVPRYASASYKMLHCAMLCLAMQCDTMRS